MFHEDREIENVLARYRPSGPPASLRQRILSPSRPRRSRWVVAGWFAMAAMLVMCLGLHLATQQLLRQIQATLSEPSATLSRLTDEATKLLNGNSPDRRYLSFVLAAGRPRMTQSIHEIPANLLREIQ